MSAFALKARYVFPVTRPPLADGIVVVSGQRIESVGRAAPPDVPLTDLGEVALLPGLVNAHTHLEFSALGAPLGRPGMSLPDWLRLVIELREGQAGPPGGHAASILRGQQECLRTGTTTIGEIATATWPVEAMDASLDAVVFRELIGFSPDRAASALEAAKEHLALGSTWPSHVAAGLSPHAPYSLRPDAVQRAVQLAAGAARPVPVAMHLAESPEELQFLQAGSGPLVDLLRDRGAWDERAVRPGSRPLDYLRMLSHAPRSLVVHGNYLDEEELRFLAARENMSLVYCPRTHDYFGHRRFPLARALKLGVRVALGTDSRASSPDLNLLEEMRCAARLHPEVPPAEVLKMGTLSAAAALGRADRGSLEPGKLAHLTAIALPQTEAEPHDLLLQSPGQAVMTWHRLS